ncbi:MAG TPA: MCE family protein [Actinomycetota bacterium]|nr:MCE family protein [Actinomycetota bacterium]
MTRFIKPLTYALVVLLIGGGVSLMTTSGKGSGTYEVTAYFTKAIGLFKDSDVDVLGVPVGKVKSIEPAGTKVKVVMEISDEHRIPDNAFAQIVPISVISDRYIQLAPPYQSGDYLQDGDVLDVDRTQIPAELDDVFKQLKKLLDAIEPGRPGEPGALGDLIVQLNRTLKARGDDLQGTITNTAQLTENLADAQEFISGLLVNLEDLFGTLATRADSIGTLNKNFAIVMATLAESRSELEGTLANLAMTTEEVGDLIKDNRHRLGRDLEIAARLTSVILKNRESVEQSLAWLPVVAIGLTNANHPEPIQATDVRDNAFGKFECETFAALPEPIRDIIMDLCIQQTGEPPPAPQEQKLDCDRGVRKVRRQIQRLEGVALPRPVQNEILRPMKAQLRKLAKKCRDLGEELGAPGDFLDRILDDVGGLPELDDPLDDDGLTGNAAGPTGATGENTNILSGFSGWMSGMLDFIGWSW